MQVAFGPQISGLQVISHQVGATSLPTFSTIPNYDWLVLDYGGSFTSSGAGTFDDTLTCNSLNSGYGWSVQVDNGAPTRNSNDSAAKIHRTVIGGAGTYYIQNRVWLQGGAAQPWGSNFIAPFTADSQVSGATNGLERCFSCGYFSSSSAFSVSNLALSISNTLNNLNYTLYGINHQ